MITQKALVNSVGKVQSFLIKQTGMHAYRSALKHYNYFLYIGKILL